MDKTQTDALYALNDLFNEDEERVGQPAAAEIAELWDKTKAQD